MTPLRVFALAFICVLSSSSVTIAQDVKRVSVNGYELAYVDQGQGDPVIFVHGGLQDYRMWNELLPQFGARYRAVAYSRRNNYPNVVSPEGTPDGAADVHGEDLAAFARALGFSKIRVVAHSSGAHAALFFAATHPEMIVSLAVNEPPALGMLNGLPNSADILKEFAGLAAAREALKNGDVEQGIPMFVDVVGGAGAYERRSDADKKMNLENVASYQADAVKRPRMNFTCDMAKAITSPTLLSGAQLSPRVFHHVLDQLEACLPNREKVEIPASSHTVTVDNPKAYQAAILAFFEKY
jgi:non-heme chloroperoxidase